MRERSFQVLWEEVRKVPEEEEESEEITCQIPGVSENMHRDDETSGAMMQMMEVWSEALQVN